jgi:DNA-binding MarR family transcriptional regulator
MAARGDLIRERDERDQRINRITVTESGIRALQRTLPGVIRAERRFFELIAPEIREAFVDSLRGLGEDHAGAAPPRPVAVE